MPSAANSREPWVELGLNRCGPHASAPDSYHGGWCNPSDAGQMARTDPHTTTNYMVGGLMGSPSGEEVFAYVASPGALGHGEIFVEPPVEPVHSVPAVRKQLGNNSAITLLRVRKHGFVAVEGPSGPLSPLSISSGCLPAEPYELLQTWSNERDNDASGILITTATSELRPRLATVPSQPEGF